jgi:hypothetical protein
MALIACKFCEEEFHKGFHKGAHMACPRCNLKAGTEPPPDYKPPEIEDPPPQQSPPDIESFLTDLGLAQHLDTFNENDITLDMLADLSGDDLKDIGISSLGHRKVIAAAAARPSEVSPVAPQAPASPPAASMETAAEPTSDTSIGCLMVVIMSLLLWVLGPSCVSCVSCESRSTPSPAPNRIYKTEQKAKPPPGNPIDCMRGCGNATYTDTTKKFSVCLIMCEEDGAIPSRGQLNRID